jgi:uncharacterized membrane protein YccC
MSGLSIRPRGLGRRLRVAVKPPRDPGFGALRRAARAAVVIPLVFAFTKLLLNDAQALIFVMFGCFSLLVMSDFGGRRRPRVFAYLWATITGGMLVALGTVASTSAWLAAAAMLVVGFAVSFSRIFGGYVAAANLGMLLAFVIAVTIPATPDAIPARVGGWAIAGLVSTVASVALWPLFERVTAYHRAAMALLTVADLVEGLGSSASERELARLKEEARKAVDGVRQAYAAMAKRPVAPPRRDRAFVELLIELDRIVEMIERPFNEDATAIVRTGLAERDRLITAVVAALRGCAAVLTGGAPPDRQAIDDARTEHRAALDRWAAEQLRAERAVGEVLDALDFEDTVRVVSYVTLVLGANSATAAGVNSDAGDTAKLVLATIRAHLESPSTVLQAGLRVAIGLAVAVWVAREFDLSHGFWVVLGTIQVLRSNALGTGRTVILAVLGNAIGVVIGGLFALVAGNHPALMWIAFPVAVFGAAYAATMIGFMLSQAAFTINLIVVFNLISPAGWQVGLVRIEDLLVGAVISLGVGLLLWPQGARRELVRALAAVYRGLAEYLEHAFDRILGFEPVTVENPAQASVLRARDRADAAFDTFSTERGGGSFDSETAALLLSSAGHGILAGDLLQVIARDMGYRADTCADGGREVREQVRALLAGYRGLADELSLSRAAERDSPLSLPAVRQAELGCLRRWQTDPGVGKGAMAVVMAGEWVQDLAHLETDLEGAVTVAAEAARKPWWR